jgi:Arc/MetJ-type ribon-helix-helix transcriptional regulator
MEVSLRLPDEDVEFLDAYAQAHSFSSRSAVIHEAIHALRRGLPDAYRDAWDEWESHGDAELWHQLSVDGV